MSNNSANPLEIARKTLEAAEYLLEGEYFRSALSRAYYAAFQAVCAHLVANKVPWEEFCEERHDGRKGWTHSRVTVWLKETSQPQYANFDRLKSTRHFVDYKHGKLRPIKVIKAQVREARAIVDKFAAQESES